VGEQVRLLHANRMWARLALSRFAICGGCAPCWCAGTAPSRLPGMFENATAFAANAGGIDLPVRVRAERPTQSIRRDDGFHTSLKKTDQKLSWMSPNTPCATFPVPPLLTG
jgi:hypothetical protein